MTVIHAGTSLEDDNAFTELSGRLIGYHQAIDELVASAESLTTLRDAVCGPDPISPSTNRLVNLELQTLQHRSGISMEDLVDAGSKSTTDNDSGFAEKLKELWRKIMEVLKRAAQTLQKMFGSLHQTMAETHERSETLIDELRSMGENGTLLLAPPGNPYPYELTATQLQVLSINGKIPTNWYREIPMAIQRFGEWMISMVNDVESREDALYQEFKSGLAKQKADWSGLEALVDRYLKDYHHRFNTVPQTVGSGKLIWKGTVSDNADVVAKLEALRTCFGMERKVLGLANTVTPVTLDQLLAVMTDSLKWPRLDNSHFSQQLSKQVGEMERLFGTTRNTYWEADDQLYSQQVGRAIPGALYRGLMAPWSYYTTITTTFVKAMQVIQKTQR